MMKIGEILKDIQAYYVGNQRRAWLVILFMSFFLLGIVGTGYWFIIGEYYETTDDAYVNGNLIQVMPETTGYVTEILADVTNLVQEGQPLIILDKTDAELALKKAEAQLALTVRQVAELYHRVEELKANVVIKESNLQEASDDYERRKGLVAKYTISVEDLQHAKFSMDNARDSLELAKRQLATTYQLVQNIDFFNHPQIRQAAENVRHSYIELQRTTIFAPETGYVAKRLVQVGQEVGKGSLNIALMIIVPLDELWVDANYKESQLKNIRIGQSVRLISDSYGSEIVYQGKVMGLSPGTGSIFDLLPPQNATGNWIKVVQRLPVRIVIDQKQLIQDPLRIGLSMTVSINTHDRKGAVLMQTPETKVLYKTKDYSVELQEANQKIDAMIRENSGRVVETAENPKGLP